MVDVVEGGPAHIELQIDQVINRAEHVLRREGAGGIRNGEPQLLVDLVATHATQVVALRIEEAAVQQGLAATDGGGLTRPQFFVELQQGLIFRGNALVVGRLDRLLVVLGMAQLVENVVVRQANGPHQHVGVDLAGLVNANVQQIVLIGFELQPGTPVGDQAGVEGLAAVLVLLVLEVDARRTHDLVDDHALSTVDDEGAALGHQGQFPDEHFLLLDLAGLLVDQTAGDIHLGREGRIATLRLFHIVAGALQPVLATDEVQLQLAGVVGDRGEALQLLDQALLQKPFEARALYLDQIGQVSGGLGDLDRAAHAVNLQERVGRGRGLLRRRGRS